MVAHNYKLENFVSTPTSSDKFLRIYDKYGNLKYTIDPRVSYFYYKANLVYIKTENSNNDIVLDFESNTVAISALEKLNSAQKIILQNLLDETDYYTKDDIELGVLDNRYYTITAITNILQNYSFTSHTHNLEDLSNISLTGIRNYDVLTYKDGVWTNSSFTFDTSELDEKYYTKQELSSSTSNVFINWVHIINKPTTLSGYGITDVYSKDDIYTKSDLNPVPGTPYGTGQLDDRYYTKLQVFTKEEIEDLFELFSNQYYTKSEVDANFLSASTSFYTKEYIDATFSPINHEHPQYALSAHTHPQYALSAHTHPQYALSTHTHTEYAPLIHTHDFSTLTNTSHTHLWSEIVTAHTHKWSDITNTSHTHNDIYYTKSELNSGVLNNLYYTKLQTYSKSEIEQRFLSIDTPIYTKSEIESNFLSASTLELFNNYSLTSHTHHINNINGISITSPQNNDILVYRNGNWVNSSVTLTVDLSNYYTKSELNNGVLNNLYIPLGGTTGITGDLIPATNGTVSLGSPTRQWKELWVSGSTIYIGNIPLSINQEGKLSVGGEVIQTVDDAERDYAPSIHTHDNRYYTKNELNPVPGTPNGTGQLDDRYYTKLQVYNKSEIENILLDVLSNIYTKNEVNTLFLSTGASIYTRTQIDNMFQNLYSIYSLSSHTHSLSELKNTAHTHTFASLINTAHTHDERYHTKSEITSILLNYALKGDLAVHIFSTGSTNPHRIGFFDLTSTAHTHDNRYYTKSELNPVPGTPNGTGQLDDRYYTKLQVYTKEEIDALLSAATFTGATGIFYTKNQIDAILTNYSISSHTHTLHSLSGVSIVSPTHGDVLVYSAGTWVNAEIDIDLSDYYTKSQINILLSNYSLNNHTHQAQHVIFNASGTTAISVGGITSGTSLQNKSLYDILDMMLYPEMFPTLTDPDCNFTLQQAGLREIGESGLTLNFVATFNRGSINPQYTSASPYRSGNPISYNYSGPGMTYSVSSSTLSNTQTIYNYYVSAGTQTWTCTVSYSGGPQPKSSKGNNYSTPLPSGTTAPKSVSIIGVYPYFATTSNIAVLTKQPLAPMNAPYIEVNMVAESGNHKQRIKLPNAWSPITGIQFFNTVSNAWEWIGGSKANSLLTFTQSPSTEIIHGNVVPYTLWTNNTPTIGARRLRFYTT